MFTKLVQTEAELQATIAAGEGGYTESRECKDRIEVFFRIQAKDRMEAEAIAADMEELRMRATAAFHRADVARIASMQLAGLHERFPGLFAVEHPRPPLNPLPQEIVKLLGSLELSDGKVNPHLDLMPNKLAKLRGEQARRESVRSPLIAAQ